MWIVLTRAEANVPVHVNMEMATHMWRLPTPNVTEIVFGKEFALLVKETPEEIGTRLGSWTSEPQED